MYVMKDKCIYISEFDSEEKIKSNNRFSLPRFSLFETGNQLLLSGMDQLLITMADEGDTLVTARKPDDNYLKYWCENVCEIESFTPKPLEGASIYKRILEDEDGRRLLAENKIVNYALVPDYYQLRESLNDGSLIKTEEEPSLDIIKKLSSKAYSNDLKYKYNLPLKGIHLKSLEEFAGFDKWDDGKWLLKESMGVSGKGMVLIDSSGIAARLLKHFQREREKGAEEFDFILEPYLNNLMDFSCVFYITSDKEVIINGFQKNESKGFSYHGTGPLQPEVYDMIMATGYRELVIKIGKDMAEEGYRGYACIDSMIAEENQVIPLLEINPRMSVSRFNLRISERLGKNSRLSYIEGVTKGVSIRDVLKGLESEAILYSKNRGKGVIPLAPGIWDCDEASGKKTRIYYMIVYETEEDYEKILASWLAYSSGSICAGSIN